MRSPRNLHVRSPPLRWHQASCQSYRSLLTENAVCSSNLKQRFENAYKLTVTAEGRDADVQNFIKQIAPHAEVLNTIAGTQTFEVSRTHEEMA